eukprot:1758680-Rhodomonas_salina.3
MIKSDSGSVAGGLEYRRHHDHDPHDGRRPAGGSKSSSLRLAARAVAAIMHDASATPAAAGGRAKPSLSGIWHDDHDHHDDRTPADRTRTSELIESPVRVR